MLFAFVLSDFLIIVAGAYEWGRHLLNCGELIFLQIYTSPRILAMWWGVIRELIYGDLRMVVPYFQGFILLGSVCILFQVFTPILKVENWTGSLLNWLEHRCTLQYQTFRENWVCLDWWLTISFSIKRVQDHGLIPNSPCTAFSVWCYWQGYLVMVYLLRWLPWHSGACGRSSTNRLPSLTIG